MLTPQISELEATFGHWLLGYLGKVIQLSSTYVFFLYKIQAITTCLI